MENDDSPGEVNNVDDNNCNEGKNEASVRNFDVLEELTTESILSSINEECNKIAMSEETLQKPNENDNENDLQTNENNENDLNNDNDDRMEGIGEYDDNVINKNEESFNKSNECQIIDDEELDKQDNIVNEDKFEDNVEENEMNDIVCEIDEKVDKMNEDNGDSENEIKELEENTENEINELEENTENEIKESENNEINESELKDNDNTESELKENNENLESENNENTESELKENENLENELKENNENTESEIIMKGETNEPMDKAEENKEKEKSGMVKIKLRSFASLCETTETEESANSSTPLASDVEVTGVAVGDIVQHGHIVESDESGVMHLKISNVVGGEDCITGLVVEDETNNGCGFQISSVTSLVEEIPEEKPKDIGVINNIEISGVQTMSENTFRESEILSLSNAVSMVDQSLQTESDDILDRSIINIFRSALVGQHKCITCEKHAVCEFRVVYRAQPPPPAVGGRIAFVCSAKCKGTFVTSLPPSFAIQKPRSFFERICGNCGKAIESDAQSNVLTWQTRDFCNKLCFADHIGEVARSCYYCKNPVRVLYMVKYCVRFGSDVHQFCGNTCLETYKTTIKVCVFCQKNLNFVDKVVSPNNKEYCSSKCLLRAQGRDLGQSKYSEEHECTVCRKRAVNKFEFLYNAAVTSLCSEPCLNVFKYVNHIKSVPCCLCSRYLSQEDSTVHFFLAGVVRVFCTDSCFSVYVNSTRRIVTCDYCKVKKYNYDMICASLASVYCCSVCCINFVESQQKISLAPQKREPIEDISDINIGSPMSTSVLRTDIPITSKGVSGPTAPGNPIMKSCCMCSKLELAQFHMVMSDSTLKSFCSFVCAASYKTSFGFQVSGGELKQKETQQKLPQRVVVEKVAENAAQKMKLTRETFLKLFYPPMKINKSTMCRPWRTTMGVQCCMGRNSVNVATQTVENSLQEKKSLRSETLRTVRTKDISIDDDLISNTSDDDASIYTKAKAILPMPFPTYVPTPMAMFNTFTPVAFPVPVPVLVPVFIPTLEKTTKELQDKIAELIAKYQKEAEEKINDNLGNIEEEIGEMAITREKDINTNEGDTKKCDKRKREEMEQEKEMECSNIEVVILKSLDQILPKYFLNGAEEEFELKRMRLDNRAKRDDADQMVNAISIWESWVARRKSEPESRCATEILRPLLLENNLCDLSESQLIDAFNLFLTDLAISKDVNAIFYVFLGLQRYLFENGSTHCIFLEESFDRFTEQFDNVLREHFIQIATPDSFLLPYTRLNEEMLWDSHQLGAHTPYVLINTLFYFNTKQFKLKSCQMHHNLTFDAIEKQEMDGQTTLTYNDGDVGVGGLRHQMRENRDKPLRCPVRLYEFFLSKCPPSAPSSPCYVSPLSTCYPDSPVWYTHRPIPREALDRMLRRTMLVKEIQESLYETG